MNTPAPEPKPTQGLDSSDVQLEDLESIVQEHADASDEELADAISGALFSDPGVDTSGPRLDIDPDELRKGLGKLVVTILRLLHELLEKQAVRRVDSGTLNDNEVERLGRTLMLQAREIDRIAEEFGVQTKDCNLDLGALGSLM